VGTWNERAREEAARHWGRRHYRWYAGAHLIRVSAPAIGTVGVLIAGGVGAWLLARLTTWPTALRLVAAGIAGLVVIWLIGQAITGAGVRHRAAGRRHPIPALALITAALLVALSLLLH
jgi:hypothetical protein